MKHINGRRFLSPKKSVIILALLVILAISTSIYKVVSAAQVDTPNAKVEAGLNNSFAPDPSQFTKKKQVYLEISQSGDVSTLEAAENWTKVYFDYNKKNNAIVGILDGAYRGCGADYSLTGCISGSKDVEYEFYASGFTSPDANVPNFKDDIRCSSPFAVIHSNEMDKSGGWNTLSIKPYLAKGCDNAPMVATPKTGKLVVFVHALWRTKGSDRTNAFKVGGAYTDGSSAIAGYWSKYKQSTRLSTGADTQPGVPNFTDGQYAVQDRIGTNKSEQGNYSFAFGPDCYLSKDQKDTKLRYLKWYDVDLNFYSQLPNQPDFELRDVTTGDIVPLTDVDGTVYRDKVSGSALGGRNVFKQMSFEGKGGHIYAWRWHNIVQRDGIVFWMPYDDFPYLNKGCGKWDHDFEMTAGVLGQGTGTTEFPIAGGQTARIDLSQYAKGPDAGPTTDIDLTVSAANSPSSGNKSIATTFSSVGAGLNGGTNGPASSAYSRVVSWRDLARLGPSTTYPTLRKGIYADFKVRPDAPDGARYCATAVMSPKSNTVDKLNSTPRSICFVVTNPTRPFLTTLGGDVHAGNDCIIAPGQARLPQTIKGWVIPGVTEGSSGSYIVSAGDAITQFGSGGSPSSSNLTFGKTGFYGSICRPSIDVLNAELAKGGYTTIDADPATPFNIGDTNKIVPGGKYLVRFNGSGTVYGVAKAPVTILSTETLTIQGAGFGSDTDKNNTYARSNLPVVGVIARNIDIKREVVGVTAQLYAVGNIDTCSDSTAYTCRSVLFLRGFAMAHDFSFKRSGTGTNGLQRAEIFGFGAAFYLNPPPGFGSAAGAVKYLGERAPLY